MAAAGACSIAVIGYALGWRVWGLGPPRSPQARSGAPVLGHGRAWRAYAGVLAGPGTNWFAGGLGPIRANLDPRRQHVLYAHGLQAAFSGRVCQPTD